MWYSFDKNLTLWWFLGKLGAKERWQIKKKIQKLHDNLNFSMLQNSYAPAKSNSKFSPLHFIDNFQSKFNDNIFKTFSSCTKKTNARGRKMHFLYGFLNISTTAHSNFIKVSHHINLIIIKSHVKSWGFFTENLSKMPKSSWKNALWRTPEV